MTDRWDVAVVGGGIVGLATARSLLLARPGLRVTVLERGPTLAYGQTGHNSGVIHSGAYYRPGSVKARLCGEGRRRLIEYLKAKGLEHRIPGKLIVAVRPDQVARLRAIGERAATNGVEGVRWRSAEEIRSLEPRVRGVAALEVPGAGIVDYGAVARSFARDIEDLGGTIRTRTEVRRVRGTGPGVEIEHPGGTLSARVLVGCAGIEADRLARHCGADPTVRIVPFRGEYYSLRDPDRWGLTHLIYPVPDPALPFLGVHLTLTLHRGIEAGPNAVLALGRQAYRRHEFSLRDLADLALDPGSWALARRWVRTGIYEELRSLSRSVYARDLREMVPSITEDDLRPGGAGIRAQAVDRAGRLVDDFVLIDGPRALHVINAPSPAATSSLALADEIRDRLLRRRDLAL
ncbi:MAG: L-2-hydroxyglutarate oxidase [Thermoplasmata archaeon]